MKLLFKSKPFFLADTVGKKFSKWFRNEEGDDLQTFVGAVEEDSKRLNIENEEFKNKIVGI